MNYKSLKSNLIYSILIVSLFTAILNFILVPLYTEFFIKYFNLFTASVMLLLISIFIGVLNKIDFKLDSDNTIYVSKAVSVIMSIELLISLNFYLLDFVEDRIFVYAICLTPCFGFILSRPMLRLYFIESKFEKMNKDCQSKK